jgi:hypothetical protein
VSNAQGRLSFAKQGDSWTLGELPEGETLDQNKVKAFVNKVSNLNLEEPVGKEMKPEYGLREGAEVFLVSGTEADTVSKRYVIGAQRPGEQSFYAKADDNDWVVAVSKWSAEDTLKKGLADFVKPAEKTEEAQQTGGQIPTPRSPGPG